MAVYVLGTHVSHNGSACLLKDGRVEVAIEKERITRIKHDGGNDNAAVNYCLRAAGIRLADVDLVVQNANFDMLERRNCGDRTARRIVEEARNVVTISHHLAHAYSTVGTSPFREMAALVIDGCGNCFADCIDTGGAEIPERPPNEDLEQVYFEKDSYYAVQGGKVDTVYKDFSPWGRHQRYPMFPGNTMHSIGGAYLAISRYVFRGFDDPGKLMGLAPYGRPGRIKDEMFRLSDGRVFQNYGWMENFDAPIRDDADFKKRFQYCADLAYWAQREIERAILYVVADRHDRAPADNLSFSGGVALNAVANRLIKSRSKFKDVYFQPAAGDNGIALGCAFYGWLSVLQNKPTPHNRTSHFGRGYASSDVEETLAAYGEKVEARRERDVVGAAAQLIAEERVVGWFQGGSEFGPRALGHRSILALPVNEGVRDFINSKIKFREDFRPFAPSVLAEDVSTYFHQDDESPYMILVAQVREEWRPRIPAVVHRDGSARVQTVHSDITPMFHSLHKAVKKITGMSVLLNTSLNRKGMPIVETPKEAVDLLLGTELHALIVGDWVVFKHIIGDGAARESEFDYRNHLERMAHACATGEHAVAIAPTRVIIAGLEEQWTFDATRTPAFQPGSGGPVAYTLKTTVAALQEICGNPRSILRLRETGLIEIAGCSSRDELLALSGDLAFLIGLGCR